MGASSEDELPPSLSAKKRRSLKRSRLSSDSDEDKRKTRSWTKLMNSSSKEINEDETSESEQLNQTPCSVSQTPRSSDRLRGKSSFSLPSREKILDSMSPRGKKLRSQEKVKSLKPRKLVNNFLRERSSYVSRGEGRYDSDDSGMSDFINDDDEDDDEDDDDSESSKESDNSCDGNKKDSGVCSVQVHRKRRTMISSDEENNQQSDDDNEDIPLSEVLVAHKNTLKQKMTKNTNDLNSSDSDERFTPKLKTGNKKRKVIQCSDSDEDPKSKPEGELKDINDKSDNSETDYKHTNNSPIKSASLRPRSRRLQKLTEKQEDEHHRLFKSLIKKRQTAKLDPKERQVKKQAMGDSEEISSSNSSDGDHDPLEEAAACFEQHSSELEEDDDDRDFIVDDGGSSDDGMNSDGASQFLKLLDAFTAKQQDEEVNGEKNVLNNNEDTQFRRRRKRRKKKKERKASKWRRIKMENDSEESDVNDTTSDLCNRHPPLHVAVLENDVPLVNNLVKQDPDCVYEIGYRKRTALHLAALEGKVELVKLLLQHGADRTAVDCYHLPAIAYALDGHPECVQLLLHHANVKNISKSMAKNLQEMNLLHFAIGETRDGLHSHDRAKCLEFLFSKDKKFCTKLLGDSDARNFLPLVAAVFAGQHECVGVLLRMGADVLAYKTEDGGNILHFAVECASHFKETCEPGSLDTSLCLKELLNRTKLLLDQPDDHDFTPLMYACESGNAECVKLLLENGASIKCADSHGTSSLHLAAMSGDTQCVQLLLNCGHQVDCVDRYGWPPLLYANFKAHESCVLALMKPKPEQVFVLGTLLRRARNELEKKRTVKVVKNVLVSLANHDAYYTVFNDFIRQNPEMLDENNYGLLQHIWRAILDFDNKRRWFLKKLSEIRARSPSSWIQEGITLKIDRENVLGSAINQMGKTLGHALRNRSLHVTFKDEPGICTGPKREFFTCFCKDIIDAKHGLFIVTDDAQYSPVPNGYFAKFINNPTQQDLSQTTASQEVKPVKHEEQVSRECTDEELMLALSQAEQHAATQPNIEPVSEGTSDVQPTPEGNNTSQSGGVQASLHRTGTEEDGTAALVNGETNVELSSQALSDEQAEESSVTSLPSHSTEQDLSNSSADTGNIASMPEQQTWISCTDQTSGDKAITNLSLRSKLKKLRFIGRMVGFAICQDLLLDLHLSKPFVKQVLGMPLSHPDDLISFDYELHRNAVIWVRENSVNDLDLPFSLDAVNPWNNGKPTTIELSDDSDKKLTDENKEEYVKLVSQFKLETSIKDEVAEFSGGLNEVIPRDLLSLFTADEFSLLIGGVSKLDVQDWKKHTVYTGCSSEHDVIQWFWNVVSQLKEEEKALLMKFSTGSPCVPIGGFAALTGLSGPTKFNIMNVTGLNKIPTASTCFNMLKLTSYSSEKHLKDKLLIAIRHGAEGFSFS